ncbi:MAG: phospholipase D-like domain-containing protein [Acidiferrobacterales bacterium]
MKIYLTSPRNADKALAKVYGTAFKNAQELFLVSAYLTAWQKMPKPNKCKTFTFIIGKDFGITRKAACNEVLKWLPKRFLSDFLVADNISGFHPKALFWRGSNGRCHMLVGSSNLTEAAMSSNVEANVSQDISTKQFDQARQWVGELAKNSVPVNGGWMAKYVEAKRLPLGGGKGKKKPDEKDSAPVMPLVLPSPTAGNEYIKGRRRQIAHFEKNKQRLLEVFRQGGQGKLKNGEVYEKLKELWTPHIFQLGPWQISAKRSNWKAFSRAFVAICDAPENERDSVVRAQLDWLAEKGVPTRGAVFTELLCRYFPDTYPVLNNPIKIWARAAGYKAPRGASEGTRYLFLAKTLRAALAQKPPRYPARNLAELDLFIWAQAQKQAHKK